MPQFIYRKVNLTQHSSKTSIQTCIYPWATWAHKLSNAKCKYILKLCFVLGFFALLMLHLRKREISSWLQISWVNSTRSFKVTSPLPFQSCKCGSLGKQKVGDPCIEAMFTPIHKYSTFKPQKQWVKTSSKPSCKYIVHYKFSLQPRRCHW